MADENLGAVCGVQLEGSAQPPLLSVDSAGLLLLGGMWELVVLVSLIKRDSGTGPIVELWGSQLQGISCWTLVTVVK